MGWDVARGTVDHKYNGSLDGYWPRKLSKFNTENDAFIAL